MTQNCLDRSACLYHVEIGITFQHPKYSKEYLLWYVIIKQDILLFRK